MLGHIDLCVALCCYVNGKKKIFCVETHKRGMFWCFVLCLYLLLLFTFVLLWMFSICFPIFYFHFSLLVLGLQSFITDFNVFFLGGSVLNDILDI